MNDKIIYEYNEGCTKDVSFYDTIQSLSKVLKIRKRAMDEEINLKCTDNCTEEASLYEMIQSLPIELGLKEQILEKVRNLNKLNSELEDESHNCRIEVKKLKKIIFKLVYELYDE